jgi:hypothetical protein
MRAIIRLIYSALLCALSCAAAAAAEQPYIQIRSEVDRSALWVGDRFHDVITVIAGSLCDGQSAEINPKPAAL